MSAFEDAMNFLKKWDGIEVEDIGGFRNIWGGNGCEFIVYPLCIAAMDAYTQHPARMVKIMLDIAQGDWKRFLEARRIAYKKDKDPGKGALGLMRMNDLSKYLSILENDKK